MQSDVFTYTKITLDFFSLLMLGVVVRYIHCVHEKNTGLNNTSCCGLSYFSLILCLVELKHGICVNCGFVALFILAVG